MPDGKKTLEELGFKKLADQPIEPGTGDSGGQISISPEQIQEAVNVQAQQLQDIVAEARKLNRLGQVAPGIGSETILGLVDRFVADALLKNIFTDTNQFAGTVAQQTPVGAYNHIPNADPRLLNFNPTDPHPHTGRAGVDPSRHVIPQSDTKPLHDTQGLYAAPGVFDGTDGVITPSKLAEIYQKNAPPGTPRKPIQDQAADISANVPLPLQRGGGGAIPNTQAAPGIEKEADQIPVGHTPQPIAEREKLYEQANDRNNHGSRINELLEFHKSVEENRRLEKEQFDSNPEIRGDIYRGDPKEAQARSNIGGTTISKPTQGDQLVAQGDMPPRPSEHEPGESFEKGDQFDAERRADIYGQPPPPNPGEFDVKSNIGGTPQSKPTLGDQRAAQRKVPAPDLLFPGPEDAYEGERPRTLQDTPADPNTGQLPPDQRADIYGDPNSNPGRNAIYATKTGPTVGDQFVKRGDVPRSPSEGAENARSGFGARSKGHAYSDERREVIYNPPFDPHEKDLKSNIGGGPGVGEESIPTSHPTLGDEAGAKFLPPTRDLLFKGPEDPEVRPRPLEQPSREDIYKDFDSHGNMQTPDGAPPTPPLSDVDQGTGRRDFAPIEGQIGNRDPGHRLGNAYDDGAISLFDRGGNYSAIPGEVSALKYFDIFAISHWFRSVAKEGIPLPVVSREDTSGGIGRDKVEISTEAIAKGVQWNVSQLLLAAMNPTDAQGYGALNALWNPLSLTLSAIPLLRSTPVANITVGAALAGVGFGGYKQNALDAAAASKGGFAPPPGFSAGLAAGERLLLMRQGQYEQRLDGNQVAQLRFANAGYKGNIVGSSQGTIEGEGLLAALFSAAGDLLGGAESITQQVDEPAGSTDKPTVDRNLYSVNARYGDAAYLPQKELEQALEDQATTGEALKVASLFKPYGYPGGSLSPFSLGTLAGATGLGDSAGRHYYKAAPGEDATLVSFNDTADAPGLVAATTDVQVSTHEEENANYTVAPNPIPDDELYMPFSFEDLRDPLTKASIGRFLYFRAFLKPGMAETFTPDWQVERYYGRVDQVPIYMGTLRTLALSFDVVAWSPKDLPVMWSKLQKLQSMVYPYYNKGGFLKSGPIVRMRIGDLFANQVNKGLPGYITSMDWSYDDGIWNLKTDFRVPRKVSVSLGFTVIHDGNPGTYPFKASEPQDINIAADLNQDYPTTSETDGFTFGTGKITNKGGKVQIKIDQSEIRKIFETVRNKTGESG